MHEAEMQMLSSTASVILANWKQLFQKIKEIQID
jgi:hypothetical protein